MFTPTHFNIVFIWYLFAPTQDSISSLLWCTHVCNSSCIYTCIHVYSLFVSPPTDTLFPPSSLSPSPSSLSPLPPPLVPFSLPFLSLSPSSLPPSPSFLKFSPPPPSLPLSLFPPFLPLCKSVCCVLFSISLFYCTHKWRENANVMHCMYCMYKHEYTCT